MGGSLAAGQGGINREVGRPFRASRILLEDSPGNGYSPGMDSVESQPVALASGKNWLDSLSGKAAAAAAQALESLPRVAGPAGEDLPVVIAAWCVAAPDRAARLIEEWLATVNVHGDLIPTCPVVCQLAEMVLEALPDRELFLARILPGLARYVERVFDRFDPEGTGLPRWPSEQEAFFPREYAPGRFTVDLAVLLSNEAAAFDRLATGHAELDHALGVAESEQRELDDWLGETFWDEEAATFDRLDDGSVTAPDFSPVGFLPLLWEGRTEAMAAGLRGRLEEWNPAGCPVRTWVLFFALALQTPHNSVIAWMRRQGLPHGASAAEQAAWTVLAIAADGMRAAFMAEIPPVARWFDVHGKRIALSLLAAGIVLLAGLLFWQVFHRADPDLLNDEALEHQARQACADGHHERAAALYAQGAKRGNEAYFRYRQGNEWMHLERYADAEAAYRAVLTLDPASPNVRMNLALAILKQGRREEARDLYKALAEEARAHDQPEVANRARLAADLIARQLALDRE